MMTHDDIAQEAEMKEVGMIGPATVGGIKTLRCTKRRGELWPPVAGGLGLRLAATSFQGLDAFALETQARAVTVDVWIHVDP